MKKKKMLYFCFHRATFVERDIAIFSSAYNVSVFSRPAPKASSIISYVFLQWFFLVWKIWRADILVCQFAGHHSVLPVLFGKIFGRPVLLIPGGSDCVSFPSINYGQFRKKFIAKTTRWSYRHAEHIAPVDESLLYCDYSYDNKDLPAQGILYFCKALRTPATVIHNGFDLQLFHASTATRNPKSFITIAGGSEQEKVFLRKGIDLILEVAPLLPECHFTVVGASKLPAKEIPANVTLLPFVDQKQLPELLSKETFYLQLSMCEGFPNALCEAMLCGCVPIVSRVASMAVIIGDSGFVLEKHNVQMLNELLKKALVSDFSTLSNQAREQIVKNYPTERRRDELLQLVNKLVLKRR